MACWRGMMQGRLSPRFMGFIEELAGPAAPKVHRKVAMERKKALAAIYAEQYRTHRRIDFQAAEQLLAERERVIAHETRST